MITYNPSGGDLGRANIKPISALELQIIIPHIANILEELELRRMHGELPFKYAFELNVHEKNMALLVIEGAKLPPRVSWYETDGLKLFAIRGPSGGITSSYICYLVTKGANE